MPHVPHQTMPFRRPLNSWPQDLRPDPAEVGTAFGLELCLEGRPRPRPDDGVMGANGTPQAPTLCP